MKRSVAKKDSGRSRGVKKTAARQRGRTARRKTAGINQDLLPTDKVRLLRSSFGLIEPQANIVAMIFYRNLFTLDPSLRRLFHTSVELQGRKLMETISYAITTLERPDELIPVLESLGRRHVLYGTKNEHYATVTSALLQTLGECLGEKFTPDVREVWARTLEFVSATMQRGAHDVQVLLDEPKAKTAPGKCPFGH